MAAMVVQFGFAIMPFGRTSIVCGLTSLTTSGTSGSIRQAEELSITTAPAAANLGASSREVAAPAKNRTISSPAGSAAAASSTAISRPPQYSRLPADRDEANKRTVSVEKRRSARTRRIASPTTPVAPTIPILRPINASRELAADRQLCKAIFAIRVTYSQVSSCHRPTICNAE